MSCAVDRTIYAIEHKHNNHYYGYRNQQQDAPEEIKRISDLALWDSTIQWESMFVHMPQFFRLEASFVCPMKTFESTELIIFSQYGSIAAYDTDSGVLRQVASSENYYENHRKQRALAIQNKIYFVVCKRYDNCIGN